MLRTSAPTTASKSSAATGLPLQAPEGNFRPNEPSAFAHLSSPSHVKVLWVDEPPIAAQRDGASTASTIPFGSGLRNKLLHELHAHRIVPLKTLVDAFPVASEYYREQGALRLVIEELHHSGPDPADAFLLSRWESLFAAKRFAVILTLLRASPPQQHVLSSSSQPPHTSVGGDGSGGSSTLPSSSLNTAMVESFNKRLLFVKSLFQHAKFSSSLKRCIVVDPPAQFAAALDTDNFLIVKSTTPLSEIAGAVMRDIGADIVHHITSRILALTLNSSYSEAISSFRTPMDKADFADASTDPKSELGRTIRCRASKRRGDLLLQLEAPDAALMAYGEMTLSSSDSLWTAAILESVASARYSEGRSLLTVADDVRFVQTASTSESFNPDEASIAEKMNRIEGEVRDYHTRFKKSASVISNTLPPLTRPRLTKEVEEPLMQRMDKISAVAYALRMCGAASAATAASSYASQQFNPALASLTMLPADAAGQLLSDLYDETCHLWYFEMELYLVEAFHSYRTLQPRLFELEAELYLKLAWLRAEQRNTKRLLDAVADLTKTLRFVSNEAALRVSRVIPEICIVCGCVRKAVSFAVDCAVKDKKAGNPQWSLALLLQAARWSNIPITVDPYSGNVTILNPTGSGASSSSSSSSGAATTSNATDDQTITSLVSPWLLPPHVTEEALLTNLRTQRLSAYRNPIRHSRSTSSAFGGGGYGGCAAGSLLLLSLGGDVHVQQGTASSALSSPASSGGGGWRENFQNLALLRVRHPAKSHVSLLFEVMDAVEVLSKAPSSGGWSLPARCQLPLATLFLYSSLTDAATQSKLLEMAQGALSSGAAAGAWPANAWQLAVHPPMLLVLRPLPPPPHLALQTVSMGGAMFTYIDKERLKLTVLSLNGRRLSHTVVWAAGESARVEIQLTNPFDIPLHIASLAATVEFTPSGFTETDGPASPETTTPLYGLTDAAAGQPSSSDTACLPYVLKDIVLSPRVTSTLRLYVLPRVAGVAVLTGIEAQLRHLEFPVKMPMAPVVSVPVVGHLPKVDVHFPRGTQLCVWAGQSVPLKCAITNVSNVAIHHVGISVHSKSCQLNACEGCREISALKPTHASVAASPTASSTTVNHVVVQVSRLILRDVLPLQPGETVHIDTVVLSAPRASANANGAGGGGGNGRQMADGAAEAVAATVTTDDIRRDELVFRVDYHADYPPPTPPKDVPPSTPVYAVVPRRLCEARIPVVSRPSLVVTEVTLSSDRRFVSVLVRNLNAEDTIDLVIGRCSLPFGGSVSSLKFLPGAHLILPPLEIAKLLSATNPHSPQQHVAPLSLCVASIPWVVTHSQTLRSLLNDMHHGSIAVDLTEAVRSAHCDEPLEDAVIVATFAETRFCEQASSLTPLLPPHACQNWISVAPSALPIAIPAVHPSLMRLNIDAPWVSEIFVTVEVMFERMGDDTEDIVGIVAGPTRKRLSMGRDGAAAYGEILEIIALKAGEHVLKVVLTDDNGRTISHGIRVRVEHAVEIG